MAKRTRAWRRWQLRARYERRMKNYARHGAAPAPWMKHTGGICSCEHCGNPRRFARGQRCRLTGLPPTSRTLPASIEDAPIS